MSGAEYRRRHALYSARCSTNNSSTELDKDSVTIKSALWHAPAARVTWLCSIFMFGYVGTEVAIGGWVVTFMMKVRQGTDFASGMTATGFWLGLTAGRASLGFVTPLIGVKFATMVGHIVSISFVYLECQGE